MSERAFYDDGAKTAAKAAVAAIEAQTSAEIVVCVRESSASYRDVDYLFGFAASVVALVALLYVDREFELASFPLGAIGAFVVGALLSSGVAPLRRALVRPKRRLDAVRTAARSAHVALGVSRTHGRTGILVYASLFERRVEVVPDVGIDAAPLGPEWAEAVAALSGSLAPSPDLERFLAALRALGPILGHALPRAADDVNELPDEVAP